MKRATKPIATPWTRPWPVTMLLLCLLCSSACVRREVLTVLPADRTVQALPNGNYEVTPAWLQDRYRTERWLQEQLERCEGR